jgi:hypothetical protein
MDILGKFKRAYKQKTSPLNIVLSLIIGIIIFIIVILFVTDTKYAIPKFFASMFIGPLLYYGIQFIVVKTMYKYNDPHPAAFINAARLDKVSDDVLTPYTGIDHLNASYLGTAGGRNKNTKSHTSRISSADTESSESGAPPLSSY